MSGAISSPLSAVMSVSRFLSRTSAVLMVALAPAYGDSSREISSPAHAALARTPSVAVALRPNPAPIPLPEPEAAPECAELMERARQEPAEAGTPRLERD